MTSSAMSQASAARCAALISSIRGSGWTGCTAGCIAGACDCGSGAAVTGCRDAVWPSAWSHPFASMQSSTASASCASVAKPPTNKAAPEAIATVLVDPL